MENAPIPDDVRRFILQRVPSVPYLEAIVLLKNGGAIAWSSQQLAARLYVSEAMASDLLANLMAERIVARQEVQGTNTFRYAPSSVELRAILDLVETTYRRNLVEVTKLIHVRANGKARVFANAFVWRKEP